LFWYDFIVGDDWVIAAGVVILRCSRYQSVIRVGINAWWLMPVRGRNFARHYPLWRLTQEERIDDRPTSGRELLEPRVTRQVAVTRKTRRRFRSETIRAASKGGGDPSAAYWRFMNVRVPMRSGLPL